MEFTWRHIFLLAEHMFYFSDSEIADCLKVHRTTICRHKQENNSSCFRLSVDVYKALFAPTDDKPETLKRYLDNLKDTLESDDFPVEAKKLEYEYELYVKHLLRLAEEGTEAKKAKQIAKQDISAADPSPTDGIGVPVVECEKMEAEPPEQTSDESKEQPLSPMPTYECFYFGVRDFSAQIQRFLDSPINSREIDEFLVSCNLNMDSLLWDILTFLGHIRANLGLDASDSATETNEKIKKFLDSLEDYLKFLMVNSVKPEAFPANFRLVNCDSEVVDRADECREKARRSFMEADAAVKAEWKKKIERENADILHTVKYSPPPALGQYKEKPKTT